MKHWLAVGCLFLGVVSGLRAGTITDPTMGVDAGSFSDPLNSNTIITPINGGGVFGYYNATSSIITSLVFQTTITTGLTDDQIAAAFSCQQSNPFFLGCSVGYTKATGVLEITFSGVNPADGDETTNNEVDEQEGIPPLLAGCELTPDSLACNTVGHFVITLNDGFALTGTSGGWSAAANPDLFTVDPHFGVQSVGIEALVPEPGSAVLLGFALLTVGVVAGIRAR